jgi:hypothetical protein
MSKYRRPTDEELRKRQLQIDDPHSQPNLVNHIPPGVGVERIVNTYSYRLYPKQKAFCAKCEAFRHRDGFTAELDDGSWALLGSKCGADLWGESWKEATARFAEEVERTGLLKDFDDLLPELVAVRRGLERWREPARGLAALQGKFHSTLRDLYVELRRCSARADQHLVVWRRVRDRPAEDAYERRYGRRPDHDFHKSVEQRVALLAGAAFFLNDNVETLLGLALDSIDGAIGAARDTQSHSVVKLRRAKVGVAEGRERLERVLATYAAMHAFFARGNLAAVAAWADQVDRKHRYTQGPRTIARDDGRSVTLPPDFPEMDAGPVVRLRKVL